MNQSMEHITASCVIAEVAIYRNGELLLTAPPGDLIAAAYQYFNLQYPKFFKMDPLSRLGWITTEVLLSPGWDTTIYRPEDIAIVLSNAHSSLDTDYKYNDTIRDIPS